LVLAAFLGGCAFVDSEMSADVEPSCGTLIEEEAVSLSGHYLRDDLCGVRDSSVPCGRGGDGADVGLVVAPTFPTLVSVRGGAAAIRPYLSLRRDCSEEMGECAFDPWVEGLLEQAYLGDRLIFQAGSLDSARCDSISIDLEVWLLECGQAMLELPRDDPYEPHGVPTHLVWAGGGDRLYVTLGGRLGWFDMVGQGGAFSGWRTSGAEVVRIDSIAVSERYLYTLSSLCASGDEGPGGGCPERAKSLEVFDTVAEEFVGSLSLGAEGIDEIALWNGWIVGIGGGDLLVLLADDEDLDYGGPAFRPGSSIEPFLELIPIDDRALLAVSPANLYAIHSGVDEGLSFTQLYGASGPIRDAAYLGVGDETGLIAVATDLGLTMLSLEQIDEPPYVAIESVGGSELSGVVGSPDSLTFLEPNRLAVATMAADGRGGIVLIDLRDPGAPTFDPGNTLETIWVPGTTHLIADPSRSSLLVVNEAMGIGLVDLSICP
jgi:hypothetical protein